MTQVKANRIFLTEPAVVRAISPISLRSSGKARPLSRMTSIGWISLACALCSIASPVPARKPPSPATPPNIILITLDTTRADRMGFLGSQRGLTPNLDALARQSVVFTHAYSQAPLTPTSHATILTGTYPQFHQVADFGKPLIQDLPFAPEILHAHGYRTAAFVGSAVLDPGPNGATGFDRGFDTYNAGFFHEGSGEDRYHTVERRGGEVVARALAWLAKRPPQPFFLWIHLFDPHDPYDPPQPFKTRYAAQPYDGEIAYADSVVGKFLAQLKASGLYDRAMIAVVADHGESLGAHGEDTHGVFLYDDTIHVPLVIKLPGGAVAGKRIENRVELTDIAPTLLQAAGSEIPAAMQGASLLGLIKNPEDPAVSDQWRDRPAYSEAEYPHDAFRWSDLRSLRAGKYLYIRAPRRELYDVPSDPDSARNLAGESTAVADTLGSRLDTLREKTSTSRQAPKVELDPAAQERLAALGYVSAGSGPGEGPSDQGADPKDRIEVSNLVHRATSFRERARFAEAAAALQQVIAIEPSLPGLYDKLASNLIDLGQYDKAVPALRKVVEFSPYSPRARVNLAKALVQSGDIDGAIPELEFAEARMPNLVDAHVMLSMAYADKKRVDDAIRECQAVLQFLPNHYPSYVIMGRLQHESGNNEEAIENLKKAASLQPAAPDPHAILAEVYAQLGQKTDAARERAIAKRLAAKLK